MTAISAHRAELSETDGVHKAMVHGWLYLGLWFMVGFLYTRLQFLLFVGMFELYLKV